MSEPLLVITTMPDEEGARALATELVEARLAACVNIGPPIASIYRWQGRMEQGEERMLTIKTTSARLEALKAGIATRHPYELPEVIAVPITDGLSDYLAWIESCTND